MPLNAFIIRPFGKKPVDKVIKESEIEIEKEGKIERKKVKEVESVEVDFDRVQRQLIQPALDELRIQGNTTEAILAGGNIREDMFHLLVTADLVIADVTIHNPNVFYELGIRHAFYDKYTFLIRSNISVYPFDLQTDRYFQYDHEAPGRYVNRLCKALRATLASEQPDSPVFRLLPRLRAEDRSRFINVPPDFMEEVERAKKHKLSGDLRLLAVECEGFLWEIEGLRAIGRSQFELNYIYGAKVTWESIASRYPYDVEANTILSTIYQRLNEPVRSEQSLTRLARLSSLDVNTMAEIRALSGRNYKERWIADWKRIRNERLPKSKPQLQLSASTGEKLGNQTLQPPHTQSPLRPAYDEYKEIERQAIHAQPGSKSSLLLEAYQKYKKLERQISCEERALQSPLLRKAYEDYEEAFRANINNSYAGLNALSLLIVEVELARRYPKLWEIKQGGKADAERELKLRQERIQKLTSALAFTMEAERRQLQQQNQVNFWFEILEAVFLLLTCPEPERVEQAYLEAVIWAPAYAEERMLRGLDLYRDLRIDEHSPDKDTKIDIKENCQRAQKTIKNEQEGETGAGRILLFAGLRMETEKWNARTQKATPAVDKTVTEKNATEDPQRKGENGRKRAKISYLPTSREPDARKKIEQHLKKEIGYVEKNDKGEAVREVEILFGMAGGACGSDVLFHELCDSLGIKTKLYLALPKDQYIGEYVAPAGANWVDRFNKIHAARAHRSPQHTEASEYERNEPRELESDVKKSLNFLTTTKEMPRWLQGKANYNLERRCHVWMLQHALMQRHVYGRNGHDVEITLIVLWDGGAKEGVGHLGHLIELAERHGIKVVKIDCHEWLKEETALNDTANAAAS